MKQFINITASLLLIASIIAFCSCSRNMESKKGTDNTVNDNVKKEIHMFFIQIDYYIKKLQKVLS